MMTVPHLTAAPPCSLTLSLVSPGPSALAQHRGLGLAVHPGSPELGEAA